MEVLRISLRVYDYCWCKLSMRQRERVSSINQIFYKTHTSVAYATRYVGLHYICSLRLIVFIVSRPHLQWLHFIFFFFFLRGRTSNYIVRLFFIHTLAIARDLFDDLNRVGGFFFCTQTVVIKDKSVCAENYVVCSNTALAIARVLNNNGERDLFWFDAVP